MAEAAEAEAPYAADEPEAAAAEKKEEADLLAREACLLTAAEATEAADEAEAAAHEHTMLFRQRFLSFLEQDLLRGMAVG